jgi:cbb3-type cytochrome oxidase subunit 1
VGVKLLEISVVYFLLSILLGMYLSISKDFVLKGVHVHLALFGWALLGIAGVIYHLFPSAVNHKLGKWHFWLHNIGLPVIWKERVSETRSFSYHIFLFSRIM